MSAAMLDPVREKPKDDLSSISPWAFALALGTVATVIVATLPYAPW